ncbi:hypothetical protein BGZ98_002858, partial [Dissophora globulifera]
MPDLTSIFRATVQDLNHASGTSSVPAKRPAPAQNDPWVREAHNVSKTMSDLRAFILTTRPAYLNLPRGHNAASGSSRQPRRSDSIPKSSSAYSSSSNKVLNELLETVSSLSSLSDKDRDSIDLQAKVMMRQIKGAIEELESLEQERRKRQQRTHLKNNPAAALLSAASSHLTSTPAPVDDLAQHRQGVTLYLNERLAALATLHKDQYETRIAREMERRESSLFKALPKPHHQQQHALSSRPGTPKLGLGGSNPLARQDDMDIGSFGARNGTSTGAGQGLTQRRHHLANVNPGLEESEGGSSPSLTGSKGRTDRSAGHSSAQYYQQSMSGGSGFVDEDQDFEQSLSADQREMLQMENQDIVQKLETELNQVRQLESSMMELSSLHSMIQEHLEVQTLQTNRLHEEALTAINNIDAGNEQLIKAGKRNSSTRKWILFFLILA